MTRYDYETVPGQGPNLGLIVLQVVLSLHDSFA